MPARKPRLRADRSRRHVLDETFPSRGWSRVTDCAGAPQPLPDCGSRPKATSTTSSPSVSDSIRRRRRMSPTSRSSRRRHCGTSRASRCTARTSSPTADVYDRTVRRPAPRTDELPVSRRRCSTGNDGSFQAQVAVRRRVGVADCAIARVLAPGKCVPARSGRRPPRVRRIDTAAARAVGRRSNRPPIWSTGRSSTCSCATSNRAASSELQLCARRRIRVPRPGVAVGRRPGRDDPDGAAASGRRRRRLRGRRSASSVSISSATSLYSFAVPVSFDPDAPLAESGGPPRVSGERAVGPPAGGGPRRAVSIPGRSSHCVSARTPEAVPGVAGHRAKRPSTAAASSRREFSVRRNVPSPQGVAGLRRRSSCYLVVDSEPAACAPAHLRSARSAPRLGSSGATRVCRVADRRMAGRPDPRRRRRGARRRAR